MKTDTLSRTPFLSALFVAVAILIFFGAHQSEILAQNGNSGQGQATPNTGSGELILGGPGVGLTYHIVNQMPFARQANAGRYYKFTFTGIEAQADADGVPGSYPYDGYMWDKPKKNNNGHGNNVDGVDSSNQGNSMEGQDSDPNVDDEIHDMGGEGASGSTEGGGGADHVPGWWEMWARVNQYEVRGLQFSTPLLHELSSLMRLYLVNPVVIREQIVELAWDGDGNAKDPDGHFYILGSAIKEPPVPIGELHFNQTVYANGSNPPFTWTVYRE